MQALHRVVSTLLVILVVVSSPAWAASHLPSEMLCEVSAEINSPASYTLTAAQPPSTPDAPSAPKVIDKKFIAVMASLGGAESLRFATHKLLLDHEHSAGAPWVANVPSAPLLTAKYAGIYAAELLLAYELKKPHAWLPGDRVIRKFWWAYPAAMMPIHIKNTVRSIRTKAPSGIPEG